MFAPLHTCHDMHARSHLFGGSTGPCHMLSRLLCCISGDVKMTNVGHDHINDDCSSLYGIRMCYAGGFGESAQVAFSLVHFTHVLCCLVC